MAHILIVEDNALTAKIMSIGLQHAGHTTFNVQDGTDAFPYARDHAPDVILFDVMLPGLEGFQILKQLKDYGATRTIPVFMVTAKSDADSIAAGLAGGAQAYLTKPVDIADIVGRIQALLP